MAKTIGPLDPSTWPPGMKNLIFTFTKNGKTYHRAMMAPEGAALSQLAANHHKFSEAAAAWNGLSSWKQVRWLDCAQIKGKRGFQFYAAEYIRQAIPTPGWIEVTTTAPDGTTTTATVWHQKQPISPCSRRATDPTASPFDYTP